MLSRHCTMPRYASGTPGKRRERRPGCQLLTLLGVPLGLLAVTASAHACVEAGQAGRVVWEKVGLQNMCGARGAGHDRMRQPPPRTQPSG